MCVAWKQSVTIFGFPYSHTFKVYLRILWSFFPPNLLAISLKYLGDATSTKQDPGIHWSNRSQCSYRNEDCVLTMVRSLFLSLKYSGYLRFIIFWGIFVKFFYFWSLMERILCYCCWKLSSSVTNHSVYSICESDDVGCGWVHAEWYLFLASWNILSLVCACHLLWQCTSRCQWRAQAMVLLPLHLVLDWTGNKEIWRWVCLFMLGWIQSIINVLFLPFCQLKWEYQRVNIWCWL